MNSLRLVQKATVVGISGVTCAGKSSLAKLLKNVFPNATVICQDDYFLPNISTLPRSLGGLDHANWDCIDSIDMVSMMRTVESTLTEIEQKNTKSLVIIDGFLIFNYPPLARLCQLKYFMTLPYEECWNRRKTRTYNPPDPPGYFQQSVWPMYKLNFDQMQQEAYAKDIQLLDGTLPLVENLQMVLEGVANFGKIE